MGRDTMNERALIEYENAEIERMRRLEPESLLGDTDDPEVPPFNEHPQRVKYTR